MAVTCDGPRARRVLSGKRMPFGLGGAARGEGEFDRVLGEVDGDEVLFCVACGLERSRGSAR